MMKMQLVFVLVLFFIKSNIPLVNGYYELDPKILSKKIHDLVENSLNRNQIQKHLDTLAYKNVVIEGENLLNSIAESLKEKFQGRINATKNLHKAAVTAYARSQNNIPSCCNFTDTKFHETFNKEVNTDEVCVSTLKKNVHFLSDDFKEASIKNAKDIPFLQWQFFGNEEGFTTLYPATPFTGCQGDARLRPWYVQSGFPNPKQVVIVIDKSISMENLHNGVSLMKLAIEASKSVIATLNPMDKFTVLAFSTVSETLRSLSDKTDCYSTNLAQATTQNKEKISRYLDNIKPGGGSYYGNAVVGAFDFLENEYRYTDDNTTDRIILFLSDGAPTDPGGSILRKLENRNAQLNNTVVVMTYGIGNADFSILQQMSVYNPVPSKRGVFTAIVDPSNLRSKLTSFYKFFAFVHRDSSSLEPSWTVPYEDSLGLGLVMSATLSVYSNGEFVGVVGVDLTLRELLALEIDFQPNKFTYYFVIDDAGLVINHPLFPNSFNYDSLFVPITALESDFEFLSVAESMKRGESGNKTFTAKRIQPQGNNQKYGVKEISVRSAYFWKKIPETKFSVCVVVALDRVQTQLNLNQSLPPGSIYHRFDLLEPPQVCEHVGILAARDKVSLFLSPRAWVDYDHLHHAPALTQQHVVSLLGYLEGSVDYEHSIRKVAKDELVAIYKVEEIWTNQDQNLDLQKQVVWRYVGTETGSIVPYPGVQISEDFDSTFRPWYQNAVANPNKNTLSPPYADTVTEALVISMSHVLFNGRPDGQHDPNTDTVFGVAGVDLLLRYFHKIFRQMYPECGASSTDCSILDKAGFLVLTDRYVNEDKGSIIRHKMHITEYAPEMSSILIGIGALQRDNCSNVEAGLLQRMYTISEKNAFYRGYFKKDENNCVGYELVLVPETNAFLLVQQMNDADCSTPSTRHALTCNCSQETQQTITCVTSWRDAYVCECPCSSSNPFYFPCINFYNFSSESPPPCGAESPKVTPLPPRQFDLDYMPYCYLADFSLSEATSSNYHYLHLIWLCSLFPIVYLIVHQHKLNTMQNLIRIRKKQLQKQQIAQKRQSIATNSLSQKQSSSSSSEASGKATLNSLKTREQDINRAWMKDGSSLFKATNTRVYPR